jgi:hypothetical protein
MIFGASLYQTQYHHGKLIPVVFLVPYFYDFPLEPALEFFVPESKRFKNARYLRLSEKDQTEIYLEQLLKNKKLIMDWLAILKPHEDITLLSFEEAGQFSHRNLAIRCVKKYRPDCYGGMDC